MRKPISYVIVYFFVALILIIWLFPFLWMISNSLKPTQDIIQPTIRFGGVLVLDHYKYIFARQSFFLYLKNSIFVAFVSSIICMIAGLGAGYSIARFRTGGNILSIWVLISRMAPPAVLILPFFLMFQRLHLTNTLWALVLANLSFNLPFVIWSMKGFFQGIPEAIEEAAIIDGCTRMQAFLKIVIPISKPGIIVTLIFCLIFSWNEYLYALTLATAKSSKTLPVAAGDFITGYAVNWGPIFASGTLILIPIFFIVIFFQRHMVKGLTMGAIK